jgi:hypothetical protein
MTGPGPIRLEGLHCTITIDQPAPAVVLVTIEGTDTGELGDAPFRVLEPMLGAEVGVGEVELFIDARSARGASIDVSNEWSRWMSAHRDRLRHVSMLTGSRFIQLTAEFVRRFADLGELMRLYTEPAVFEGALSNAIGNALVRARS